MQEITLTTIIGMHDRILAKDGGDDRIICEGILNEVVFQANLREDRIQQAATVFWSLCAYPAFREGNKRTAYRLAEAILSTDNPTVSLPCKEMRALVQGITAFTVEIEDVEQVLQRYAKKAA
ncbi:MAG: Fic family protein [Methanoregula sp.]|nr:Fic family protein [Methanoregula sp.]